MATSRDFAQLLLAAQAANRSSLCVGLDPVPSLFPGQWRNDPGRIFDFCAGVVRCTEDLVLAFKPQIACFAEWGAEPALEALFKQELLTRQVPAILDAKRGDIGKTAARYAREAFERYKADALTLAPYAGWESLEPYTTKYPGKCLIPLCRTSNKGSDAIQQLARVNLDEIGQRHAVEQHFGRELESAFLPLYLWIAYLASTQWSQHGQFGLVTGATHPEELRYARRMAPTLPLLVPGYGDQGGTAQDAMSVDRPGAPAIVVSASKIIHPPGVDLASYDGREDDYFPEVVRPAAIEARDELWAARPNLATA